VYHRLTGKNAYIPLALNANRQGRVIAENLTGLSSEFPGTLGTAICKIFDLTVARTGLSLKQAREIGIDAIKVVSDARSKPHYYPGSAMIKTVVITEKGGKRVWGASMSGLEGVSKRIDVWAVAVAAKMSLQEIYDLDLSYAPPYSPVWDPVLIASQVAMKKVGK
jgi:NADPH-dependent 2,4-dienoyl-CoA reductase/sulfur reductase-like enzyme